MRNLALAILLVGMFPNAAMSGDLEPLNGTWGTEKQCQREAILPGGTVLAEPFEIKGEWLRHGQVWCKLNWFPVENGADGLKTGAFAACGEDAVRDYLLGVTLKDQSLTLRWDLFVKNGPLNRCEKNVTN